MVLAAVGVPASALAAPAPGSADAGSAGPNVIDSGSADSDRVDPNNYGADCPDTLIVAVAGASDSTAERDPLAEENEIWATGSRM